MLERAFDKTQIAEKIKIFLSGRRPFREGRDGLVATAAAKVSLRYPGMASRYLPTRVAGPEVLRTSVP